jgi:hypothetical protein
MDDLPKTITRVFTKYDQQVRQINVPYLPSLKPAELGDNARIYCMAKYEFVEYHPYEIEQGLEDVVFIHYAINGEAPPH